MDRPAVSPSERYALGIPSHQTDGDRRYAEQLEEYFHASDGTNVDKLRHFAKYVPRQALALMLGRQALFQRVLHVHGHVLECGVFLGGGLMTWAQLSAIHEPYNHVRRIVGFDSFHGFPSLHQKDAGQPCRQKQEGGLAADALDDLRQCLALYDLNRPLGHIPRVELVAGDARKTIPQYVRNNPHLVVALLHLDFDLYEPTKIALESFLPRMPRGAIIAFDQLNQAQWPGETLAVTEAVGLSRLRIRRFPYVPQLSYAVLQ